MKGCCNNNESGAILIESAISIGLLLFLIAWVTNLGAIIWEATLFTEANRSASRYASMKLINHVPCGSSEEFYSSFISQQVVEYLQRYQDKHFARGKNAWRIEPEIHIQRTSWQRAPGAEQKAGNNYSGYFKGEEFNPVREDTDIELPGSVIFDYSVITISNRPENSCKFCANMFQGLLSVRTSSVFMLPCEIGNVPNPEHIFSGNNPDRKKDS
jgi:hypothetical protein